MRLIVKDLSVTIPQLNGGVERIVKNVSFSIEKGKVLALVGESGSGKSITALSLLKLQPSSAQLTGEWTLDDVKISSHSERQMQAIRGSEIAVIFQEPMTALNPLHTLEKQLREILTIHHKGLSQTTIKTKILEALHEVGLENFDHRLKHYPHQLSGGERQRLMIAMAIMGNPKLIIADEPTTAIDVALQHQIIKLLKKLQKLRKVSLLFITHDLKVVKQIADHVAVLKDGEIVELATAKQFFKAPQHSYSKQLLQTIKAQPSDTVENNAKKCLVAKDIRVEFNGKKNWYGKVVHKKQAVNKASFTINSGQSVGIIGESGSGKTTLAMALMKLISFEGDVILFETNISKLSVSKFRPFRQNIQMVFQDPFSSLNPRMNIQQIIEEGLSLHFPHLNQSERLTKIQNVLRLLELDDDTISRYPHEFSGGQRQRIAIARALILNPKLIIFDEPTSALDRSNQLQIINILKKLQATTQISYLFISHDLDVIKQICDMILVMKKGEIIEQAKTHDIFYHPKHPYTKQLTEFYTANDV